MAGEIFIAKEATSQDIKTIVDANGNAISSLSTNLATANANINTLNINVNSLANSIKRPNGKNYKFIMNKAVVSTLTQILSISGGGYLSAAYNFNMFSSNTYAARLQIVIDGVTLLFLNNVTAPLGGLSGHGIINHVVATYGSAGLNAIPLLGLGTQLSSAIENAGYLQYNYPAEQACTGGGAFFVIGELIRFNSSLQIYVSKASNYVYTGIEYYLD